MCRCCCCVYSLPSVNSSPGVAEEVQIDRPKRCDRPRRCNDRPKVFGKLQGVNSVDRPTYFNGYLVGRGVGRVDTSQQSRDGFLKVFGKLQGVNSADRPNVPSGSTDELNFV